MSICELFYGGGEINQTPTSASENTFFTAVESTNHKLQYGGLNDPRRMIYTPVTVRSRRPLLRTFLPPLSSFFPPNPLTLTGGVAANGPRTITANGEHVLASPSDQPFDVETPKVEFSCDASLPACGGKHPPPPFPRTPKIINKTCLRLKQIRRSYNGTTAESRSFLSCFLGKPKNVQYSSAAAAAESRIKGLQGKKKQKNNHQLLTSVCS